MSAGTIGSKDPEFARPSSTSTSGATSRCATATCTAASRAPSAGSRCTSPDGALPGAVLPPGHAGPGHRERGADAGGMLGGYIEFAVASGGYLVESNLGRTRAVPRRGLDHRRLPGQRRGGSVLPRCWPRRCTASTGPTATCTAAAAAPTDHRLHREHRRRVGRRGALHPRHADEPARACSRVQAHAIRVLRDVFPPDRRRGRAGRQRRHVRGLDRRAARGAGRGDPHGLPAAAWFDVERIAAGYTGVFGGLFDQFIDWDPPTSTTSGPCPATSARTRRSRWPHARVQHKTTITQLVLPVRGHASSACPMPIRPWRRQRRTTCRSPTCSRTLPDGDLAGRQCSSFTQRDGGDHVLTSPGDRRPRHRPASARRSSSACAGSRPATRCCVDNSSTSRSRPTTATRCPPSTSTRLGPVPRRRQADLPAAPPAARPAVRATTARARSERPLRRQDDRRRGLLDEIAYPQQADWYRRGSQDGARRPDSTTSTGVWFIDHAMHTAPDRDARTTRDRSRDHASSTTAACSSRRCAT